jgi:4-hydroxy-3-polyprenylbenzoate decarboxylase
LNLPDGFTDPRLCLPGVLAVAGPPFQSRAAVAAFCDHFDADAPINRFPLIVIADDSEFTARTLNNFLWVTFTRSNPAVDIDGIARFVEDKHWGCGGSLVIDARRKPHHAPPLIEDPEITRRVDALAASGGPLSGIL